MIGRHAASSRHAKARLAFTLVEFVAATALATLLLVAVLGVAAAFAKSAARRERAVTPPLWQHRLAEQIRWDFEQAREVRKVGSRLELRGYGDVEANSPTTRRLVEVTYQTESLAHRTWLTRRQRPIGLATSTARQPELLAQGVAMLDWQIETDDATTGASTAPRSAAPPAPATWSALPKHSRLRLLSADEQTLILETVIYLP